MASRSKPGRNDRCPCGSGKKFKNCCEGKSLTQLGVMGWVAIAAMVAVVVVVLMFAFNLTQEDGGIRPSTVCPAGQVWSPEHGHCHAPGGG